jgi:copper homeostasis protein
MESAQAALNAGADRIELCAELSVGGVTPSYGLLKNVMENVPITTHVLVRPRSGHFTYTDAEFESMLNDIDLCRELGVHGVVSGVLLPDARLDVARTQQLIDRSKGMAFTFHRAFDWVPNPVATLKQLEIMGVDWVLTSGQAHLAEEGLGLLKRLQAQVQHIKIMPGAGVKGANAKLFKEAGFAAMHLSGSSLVPFQGQVGNIPMSASSNPKDDSVRYSNEKLLRQVLDLVK